MGRSVLGHLSSRWLVASAFSLGLACAGCSTKNNDAQPGGTGGGGVAPPPGPHADAGPDEIKSVLSNLFPTLTDAEIATYAAKLNGDEAYALKDELETARFDVEARSSERFYVAQDRTMYRAMDLRPLDGGLPTTLVPVGVGGFYDKTKTEGWVDVCGVYSNGAKVPLAAGDVKVSVGGAAQNPTLECLTTGQSVDFVLILDITNSMRSGINVLRSGLEGFVSALTASNITGTIGLVTFQDTVGVNVQFQEKSPGVERSPFFAPVPLNDATQIANLKRFITRLEANAGGDPADNAAAAIDFARNNVIGYTKDGNPNVIGDGIEDPPSTSPFPKLTSNRQVFLVITDTTFFGDSNPSPGAFKPRKLKDIVDSLHATRTMVHASDGSWNNYATTTPTGSEGEVDNDYWPIQTGGIGQSIWVDCSSPTPSNCNYSPIDVEVLITSNGNGLLDIGMDTILATTCRARFPLASLAAGATMKLDLTKAADTYSKDLTPVSF